MPEFFAAIQAATVAGDAWKTLQGGMLTLSTLGILWTCRTVFGLRDDVRDLKKCVGTDGKNGLQSAVEHLDERLSRIEKRNERIDAVADAERAAYPGPERREERRRLRDSLLPEIPPVDDPGGRHRG